MLKKQCPEGGDATPTLPDSRPRSVLFVLFVLSLGVIYPGFLALIFLKPDVIEHLFSSASGYFISGLGLALLGICFVLATLHFRSASRQYQTSEHSIPPYPSTPRSHVITPTSASASRAKNHQENNNAK